ncbi:MAG: SDR family NAD(P)-dependent oxidoreductase [Gloeobacteraceae cyanobacterium ES-bin-144]|nr:SDR family NAD(P)-dependent oxidoreductase [Verrucomicrobiales bacterium]
MNRKHLFLSGNHEERKKLKLHEITLAANVVGTLRLNQSVQPLLSKATAPGAINVSSSAGQLDGTPQAWVPAYCISKTTVNMLTEQLTAALKDMMINSMCPGWCRTEMGRQEAPLSAENGADTLVWLMLEAPYSLRCMFIKTAKSSLGKPTPFAVENPLTYLP